MKIIKILSFTALILLGAFMVVFGEADDSPGAQGIGVIGAIVGSVGIYKQIRKK